MIAGVVRAVRQKMQYNECCLLVVCPIVSGNLPSPTDIPRHMVVYIMLLKKKKKKKGERRKKQNIGIFRCQFNRSSCIFSVEVLPVCQDRQWEAANRALLCGHVRRFIWFLYFKNKTNKKLYTLDQWNFDFPLWCRNKSSTIAPVNDTACSFTTRPLRMRHRHSPAAGQEPGKGNRTYSWRIIRFLPKFMPDWEAPLLVPYWREMTFWLALSVSSEKWRGLASDLRGHTLCPV